MKNLLTAYLFLAGSIVIIAIGCIILSFKIKKWAERTTQLEKLMQFQLHWMNADSAKRGNEITLGGSSIDSFYLDSTGTITSVTLVEDQTHLGIDGKPTKYYAGFIYYDDRGVKNTLLEWKNSGFGVYRWRVRCELAGLAAGDAWTDDQWIDIATGKAYLDKQKHKIVYYYE